MRDTNITNLSSNMILAIMLELFGTLCVKYVGMIGQNHHMASTSFTDFTK